MPASWSDFYLKLQTCLRESDGFSINPRNWYRIGNFGIRITVEGGQEGRFLAQNSVSRPTAVKTFVLAVICRRMFVQMDRKEAMMVRPMNFFCFFRNFMFN